jgi:hypothetical protein
LSAKSLSSFRRIIEFLKSNALKAFEHVLVFQRIIIYNSIKAISKGDRTFYPARSPGHDNILASPSMGRKGALPC